MADEVEKRPGTIQFGNVVLEISQIDLVPTVVGDVIIEARDIGNGMFQLGFATIRATGDPAKIDALVCARLRISYATAIDLRGMLDNLLKPAVPKGETH